MFIYLFIRKYIFDRDVIWTCSKYFPCSFRPQSTCAKGTKSADVGDNYIKVSSATCAYIKGTKSAGIRSAGIEDTYIKDACIRVAFVIVAFIESACTRATFVSRTYAKSTYTRNASSVGDACIKGIDIEDADNREF